MSVVTEIQRIRSNRDTIRAKLVELGLATNADDLDIIAEVVSNIVDQGAVQVQITEGETYTIPKGYHNGAGTVAGVAGGGNYNLQAKIITPTKVLQEVTPSSGYYGLSSVTVNPIPDQYKDVTSVTAEAADVLSGKVYVTKTGAVIAGTMPNNGAVEKTLDATTITYTIPKGYHNGNGVVTITLETKTVTPTKQAQTITPATGKVLSKVVVNPIPADYITTTDADATAAHILDGKTAYVDGQKIEGEMSNNGAIDKTIDGLVNTSVNIPAGYTSGGEVKLTGDIEAALALI